MIKGAACDRLSQRPRFCAGARGPQRSHRSRGLRSPMIWLRLIVWVLHQSSGSGDGIGAGMPLIRIEDLCLTWGRGSGESYAGRPPCLNGRSSNLSPSLSAMLARAPVRRLRQALTDDERRMIAEAIVEHLKLCKWTFVPHRPDGPGHGAGRGGAPSG